MKIFDFQVALMEKTISENIQYQLLARANAAVGTVARAAYNNIIGDAKNTLSTERAQQYISSLSFEKVQDGYVIRLLGKARYIEEGLQPGPMLPNLAIGPKSKQYKDGGGSYAVIPLSQPGPNKKAGAPARVLDMSQAVKSALKDAGIKKGISKTRDNEAMIGVIARLKNVKAGPISKRGIKVLEGMQVAQHPKGKKGGATRSYTTFRVASTRQDAQNYWYRHKEIPGLKAFESVEDYVQKEMNNIMDQIFKEIA